MKLFCNFTLCFAFSLSVAKAQFNDSTFYYVNYNAQGSFNKTNLISNYLLINGLKFSISKSKYALNTGSSWIFGKQQEIKSNNDFSVNADFNVFKSRKGLYYWGLGIYDKSLSLKIINRIQTGLGLAYNVFERDKSFINISNGVLYENGNIISPETQASKSYDLIRNSFRLKYALNVNEIISIHGINTYQVSFRSFENYIFNFNNNINFKLKKWISITGGISYNKVVNTNTETLLINYGVVVNHYF